MEEGLGCSSLGFIMYTREAHHFRQAGHIEMCGRVVTLCNVAVGYQRFGGPCLPTLLRGSGHSCVCVCACVCVRASTEHHAMKAYYGVEV
jgi:hypothetical protein